MYVKPTENVQPEQPRRIARRGDSSFQDELIEKVIAAEMTDSIKISDENRKQSAFQKRPQKEKKKSDHRQNKISVKA